MSAKSSYTFQTLPAPDALLATQTEFRLPFAAALAARAGRIGNSQAVAFSQEMSFVTSEPRKRRRIEENFVPSEEPASLSLLATSAKAQRR